MSLKRVKGAPLTLYIMSVKRIESDLAGRQLVFETGLLANQAHGAVTVRLGDSMVLATATMNLSPREVVDYFPLTVDFEEKFYAAGKIKGSRFIKREGRPSDNAILVSRMIDRPIRPLFPKGMTNDVQLIVSSLSADMIVPPDAVGITAASAALMLSGIPFEGPVAGVRIGYAASEEGGKEQLVVNPTYEQIEKGRLNLMVAGKKDAITMVEAGCNEVTEDILLAALELAHSEIKKMCELQERFVAEVGVAPLEGTFVVKNEAAEHAVDVIITREMLDGIRGTSKKEIKTNIHELEDKLFETYAAQIEAEEFSKGDLAEVLNSRFEVAMRDNILNKEIRIDGRRIDEIRPISIQLDLLPRPHGSALFQRGETQALTITTLGAPGAAQIIDTMDTDITKSYIHHYNFPAFSVGETKPSRGPSRRDIGHGDLAERSLIPVLPDKEKFPYTIMCVSEIMSCNGSSSMASVCGSTLSLMAAGVPIKKPVAGIAMGLVVKDKENASSGYKILTDIQGMEDFAGDMDFKVTGTRDGVNALQMDIKAKGLSLGIMSEALERAKVARLFLLDEMAKVIPTPRAELSPYAPLIITIQILPEQIREVIGKGGETIQKITGECGVEMDIEDSGLVMITAPDQESGQKAYDWVNRITYIPKAGEVFDGEVVKIMDFGAFVQFLPGKDGLVHISELEHRRVDKVEDVVKLGDKVKVKLMEIDSQGRYNLSRKALLPRPERSTAGAPHGDRQGWPHGSHGAGSRPPQGQPPVAPQPPATPPTLPVLPTNDPFDPAGPPLV